MLVCCMVCARVWRLLKACCGYVGVADRSGLLEVWFNIAYASKLRVGLAF